VLKLRSALVSAITATVFVAGAPAAHAGLVLFQPFVPGDFYAGVYKYTAAAGEASNDLTVQRSGPTPPFAVRFVDAQYVIAAGANCTQLPDGQAECPRANYPSRFLINLRDGDDRARVFTPTGTPEVYGGSGNDDLESDTFNNGAQVYGEGGDDRVSASGDGGALADGGPGNDRVFCCGGQDGGTAIGGPGNDYISAYPLAYHAVDSDGGTGNDTIISRIAYSSPSNSNVNGGDGNDVIVVHGGPVGARGGSHTIAAGAGDDTVVGGQYDDTIDGGDGRDYIDVLGGGVDTVTCGSGDNDVVRYDPTDIIADDCEVKVAP
jgi:Ca2+-binding RTX toxin-like protein